MPDGWQVGIDVGGTFTDVIAHHRARGEVRAAKVPSRTDDRIAGLLAALGAVDLTWPDVADLIHGTTIVTNAIIQDDHAKVALVATRGFADTLAIGRQNRRHLYRLDLPPKLAPQVPAERRFEVAERLDHDGQVMTALDPASVEDAVAQVEESGAEAVAVSLLHSYANPAHEEALGERLRTRFPYVALSHRVNPEAREYERTATTALSAGVMPLAAAYMNDLERAKPDASRLHLFHSAGGMASPEALRDLPLGLAASGPAAGVAAAGRMARALEIERAISFDMGGTTTDVCLILDGETQIASDRSLGGRPLRQPMVAVESIGAGGGSVARLDHGSLMVGPESAGAEPGPACYAKGGNRPTVTDANLVLGYMDADRVLAGNVRLDMVSGPRRHRAVVCRHGDDAGGRVAGRGQGGQRGHAARAPPRHRGARRRRARLHAARLRRRRARCTRWRWPAPSPSTSVVVPAHSSMFSALGCVGAEMSYAQQRTLRVASDAWDEAARGPGAPRASREPLRAPCRRPAIRQRQIWRWKRSPRSATGARATPSRSRSPPSTIPRASAGILWRATGRSTASPPRSRGSWSRSACASPRPATARSVRRRPRPTSRPRPPGRCLATFDAAEAGADAPLRPRRAWGAGIARWTGRSSSTTRGRPWSCRRVRRSRADEAGHLHIATGGRERERRRRPGDPRGHPPRADGDGRRNVAGGHALGPLAAACARPAISRPRSPMPTAISSPRAATSPCTWGS